MSERGEQEGAAAGRRGESLHDLAGLAIGGASVGGIGTCIEVPAWRLAFDMGRASVDSLRLPTVLFTHSHVDHMGSIAWHCATRALRGMPPPLYVVPPEAAASLARLFDAWRALDGSALAHELRVLAVGEELELTPRLLARPFRSPHRIACQGYSLWSVKHRLRPELRGLPREEIQRLAAAGEPVNERVEVCELAFTGDTRAEVIEREEAVRRARRLIVEVTFVDERVSVESCRAMGHVHLDELAELAPLLENEALLLTHFSSRYRPDEVRAAVARKLPPALLARTQMMLRPAL